MSIEMCSRCDRFVDLDFNVDEIEYVKGKPVCTGCLTDEEAENLEAAE